MDLPRNLRDATLRAIFYDLSFFVIVTTIGLNIVFGIIVDTFSELRDERVSNYSLIILYTKLYYISMTLKKIKKDFVSYVTSPVLILKEERRYFQCIYVCLCSEICFTGI